MSARRDYLCEHCGTYLFHAKGPLAPVEIGVPCRNRNCKLQNTVDLSKPPQVTEDQRAMWAEVRNRWRTRTRQAA